MSMFLENKAWLGLLGLTLVPLLVHLLARTRPPRFAFSSVAFLRKVVRRSSRLRKPQDFLALLFRTLAILGILGAFLGPILLSSSTSLPGVARSVVIVVDRSGSMASPEGVGTRFSEACEEAVSYLEELRPDTANVVWLDSRPEAVFPKPGPNAAFLIESLKRAEVRLEQGAIDLALRLAIEQLGEAEGERELVVISDFQKSAWKDAELAVPQGMKLVKRTVGSPVDNTAIEALFASPADPVAGQEVNVVARVQNYSATPRRVSLYLEAGGGRQSRPVELPAWGAAEAVFTTRFGQPGEVLLAASLEADDFPADDRRHAIVQVREALDLAVVGETGDAEVLEAVGEALPWLQVRREPARPQVGTADFVFAAHWDGADVASWRELAQAGTVLLLRPGPQTPRDALRAVVDLPEASGGVLAIERNERGWEVEIGEEDARVFELFRSGEFGNPLGGRFRSRSRLPEEWATVGRVLARFDDGAPALVGWGERERIVYWALTLDPADSTWADQSPFLPFVGEFLLAERAGILGDPSEVRPGLELVWRPGDEAARSQVRLRRGEDEWGVQSEVDEAGPAYRSDGRAVPGVFHWMLGEQVATRRVVNFPETESDLRAMDAGELSGSAAAERALSKRAALARGWPLWPILIAVAIVFLLGEGIVTLWRPRLTEAEI